MKYKLIITIFLSSTLLYAQEEWRTVNWDSFEQELKIASEQFKEQTYSVDIKYSTYKGLKSSDPYETSMGYFQKNNEVHQTWILGVTTIEDLNHKITLDSVNRVVALNNSGGTNNVLNLDQYKRTRELIDVLKKKESKNTTTYLIRYNSKSPISQTKLVLSKSKKIKCVIVVYAQPKKYRDENGTLKEDHLWLKMDYSNFSKSLVNKELKKKDILSLKGKETQLTNKYKSFQLADLRYKK